MGKIKKLFQAKSLKKAFACYIIFYILLALLLSLVCSGFCKFEQEQICKKYEAEYVNKGLLTRENFYDESGDTFHINYYTEDITTLFEPFENLMYNILGICSIVAYPVSFLVCIGITSILFYQRKLQKPLEVLNHAANNICNNNLDFHIIYEQEDELGRLCSSFEKMRLALQESNLEMWRQIEERKRLNAAFAHDLRTPLTVLMGESEMLIKYTPKMSQEKIIDTAVMMKRHIVRLESYVNTMNDLQRLEDIEIQKQVMQIDDMIRQMRETGESICTDHSFQLARGSIHGQKIHVDLSVMMQVYENLLTNAVRYARDMVTVTVSASKDCLCFTVSDDGKGFAEKDLFEAIKPFYKAVQETVNGHFGMGLYICKVLCEKHGGYLKLENKKGAFVTAVFR